MATYVFKAMDLSGLPAGGEVEAKSKQDVADQLKERSNSARFPNRIGVLTIRSWCYVNIDLLYEQSIETNNDRAVSRAIRLVAIANKDCSRTLGEFQML